MKKLILISCFLVSLNVLGQRVHVNVVDPDIDSKELEKNYKVTRGSTYKSSLPSREQRNMALADVKGIEKWDELKKDIFYMDLKSKSIADLKKKYPEVSGTVIKTLKEKR